jgi:hypothetical protein
MIITNNYLPDNKYCAFASPEEEGDYNKWQTGAIPRDMSLGYIDLAEFGRLHVYPIQLFKNKLK